MGEEISRLMDGEVDDVEIDAMIARLKRDGGKGTWECYHVIGDTLRGNATASRGFSQRFAARLADEPTVLAPRRGAGAAKARSPLYAWAAAAGVAAVALVGWVSFSTLQTQPTALAKAGESTTIRPISPAARPIPADFLLAHQELTPAASLPMQAAPGPHLRSVAVSAGEPRP